MPNQEMSHWAKTIMTQKYAHDLKDGGKESWEDIANRVGRTVLKSVGANKQQINDTVEIIKQRKFIPGGRYLYATGRPFHQVNNCVLLKAVDSREGWADLMHNSSMALMTGAGIGNFYSDVRAEGKPIRKTGGFATGPIALMQMINEIGRGVQQGGSRRAAIWAGLSWWHPDIHKFITLKNWIPEVRAMKSKDFNFPATMDMTNISVQLDDEFFKAYHNDKNPQHAHSQSVYWATVKQMLKTAEPGFSIDIGVNSKEVLRNAPVCAETRVLTSEGYKRAIDLTGDLHTIWTGKQWAKYVYFKQTNYCANIVRITMSNGKWIRCDEDHPFIINTINGTQRIAAKLLRKNQELLVSPPTQDPEFKPEKVVVLEVEDEGTAPVYCCDVKVEEHSFQAEGVIISNCTELTSETDSDICDLGSINMARIESLEEMKKVVELGTAFLLAGTVYSDVPYAKIDQVRTKNRRLGLGLMGLHEWLLIHGKQYGPDEELGKYLEIYATSGDYALAYAQEWDLSVPVKTRAIAPNGTISICAETTSGIEPVFCVAYKRRYLKGNTWHYQYVIDPTAKRLIDNGINPDSIEDAYTLAEDVERRVAFQAWVQKYVDHAISSTINLPAWGSELNNDSTVQKFGKMLLKYLPDLRGLTCYPDGGRSGQPISTISYKTAIKHVGETFIEAGDMCSITKGESCGS